ncbi:hypothetical protein L9F63_020746 [Diploptera punctata]|uniref:6-phosphofructo-2-kinase domain-containing protein n=1 Tax=Diploptera punctata TaxID=6984 RepID=A0AAD8ECD5_DIPPU|nr:hypothetical protein L9F63_020746 [Diploptera punctata]
MPVFWYLKTISSVTSSSITYFRKFVLFGGFLAFVFTFLYLPCLNLTGNLYLKLTACVNTRAWNCRSWISGKSVNCQEYNNKMAPTVGGICESRAKDRDDIVMERTKLSSTNKRESFSKKFGPLMVAFVGIPARGKTVMANKLARYLNWTGELAKVFTVNNREALEIRKKSSMAALQDAAQWLREKGNIAILDGTNATRSQRDNVLDYCTKLGCKLLFIESIIDDDDILSRNTKEVLQKSPDYRDMAEEKALDDFHHKIQHYLEQYEPINSKQEPNLRYIKIMNEDSLISGQLESRVVGFLSNFKPAPKTLYFSRHGESENNVLGRIGGDANLSPRGKKYGKSLARHMNDLSIDGLKVWTSELRRTKQTADDIDAPKEHIAALNELDAGVCEGLTYEEMQDKYPQEFAWRDQDKLRYRYPWGESYIDIMTRLDPVLLELEHEDNVLVVSHQAVLRCILGYFLNKQPDELPYINVPLHTLIKINNRWPKNTSPTRTTADALITVPSHYDSVNFWQLSGHTPLIKQH